MSHWLEKMEHVIRMDYSTLISKLGSLHSLLRTLQDAQLYQGEHSISYTGADGISRTLHIYIDGTELQMFDTEPSNSLLVFNDVQPGE
ncbi:MAG TPA: hypothetical protein VHP83_03980 [Aggregatilineaceae bacterium]|nr:hypothetical protein [Aggregatilineaceae bacterium]